MSMHGWVRPPNAPKRIAHKKQKTDCDFGTRGGAQINLRNLT